MDSTPLTTNRQVPLAATDAGNRSLGLSPSKPHTTRSHSFTRLPLAYNAERTDVNNLIGIKPVQGDDTVSIHEYTLISRRSIAMLLGRAKDSNESSKSSLESVSLDSQGLGTTPIVRVTLPSTAKHVSRDHAVIFHSPFGSTWIVKVLGQNGLIVNGKRKRAGLMLRLIPGESMLDFFGFKCLFLGEKESEVEQQQKSQAVVTLAQNGQSPTKRAQPTTTPASTQGTAPSTRLSAPSQLTPSLQELAVSPVKQQQRQPVGNPLKRPLGAPPSPPTSSPAPLDLSSPVKQQHRGQPKRHLLTSSSPAGEESEEDETSDEDYEDQRGSPSLSRRSARHDDSGVIMQMDGRRDSEDEA